jgi:hypothetical protein
MKNFNAKLILFNLLVIPVLGLTYWVVNSQGLRVSIAPLGLKLYRIPLPVFSFLERVKNLRDLDLAHVMAMFMLVAVWFLSKAIVEVYLFGVPTDGRFNERKHIRFLCCLSAMVIICDIAMFYRGIADQGGFLEADSGATPVIATIGYTGLLAFVAYFHVMLKRDIF